MKADCEKTALISACGKFRYRLTRKWGDGKTLCFIMLNPSTADADKDDATIRKCIGFATRLGYGSICVTNLFAYRATDPKDLKKAGFPIGDENDLHIIHSIKQSGLLDDGVDVVVAWGGNANRTNRPAEVINLLNMHGITPFCLSKTKDGFPSHPLMLAYTSMLTEYKI